MDDVVLAFSDQPSSDGMAARHGDRCNMRHRDGVRSGRLRLICMAGVLLLGACTGNGNAAEPVATPSAEPTTSEPSAPSPSDDPPPTDESEAEAAYRSYLESTVEAMETGDPSRVDRARGQALAAAQARVASLTSQERVARGTFSPAIESLEVEADTATLRDCYAAAITEHDRTTDEQVADRAGTRFNATVRLERGTDGWVVVEFEQGDFCVPAALASQLEDRYRDFWEAVSAAGQPPDPDHADLADTAAGEQFEGLRDRLADFRRQGYEVRDDSVPHPVASRISNGDTVAMVRDCRDLDPDGGIYDAETGELVDGGAEPGQRSLWETRLELIDGAWRVVDADLIEEDSGCDPAAS